jgi:hypothetical protein
MIAVFVFILYNNWKESQRLKVDLSSLAEQLGLQQEWGGHLLAGEREGVSVQIHIESRDFASSSRKYLVVRAEIPGGLPRGFVAAPRQWESWLDQKFADNLFPSGHSALDEVYAFQCDRPEVGRLLVEDAEVQQALAALVSHRRVAYVRKNHTHVAYRNFRDDVEEARGALDAVAHAALTLAQMRARVDPQAQASS